PSVLLSQVLALHEGDHQAEREQRNASRTRIPEIESRERLVVDHVDERVAGTHRPATRHREDDVEDLEREGGLDEHDVEQRRPDHRQSDAEELSTYSRTIDTGRFI